MKIQNLKQKNGMLLTVNQKIIIHTTIQQNQKSISIESSLCDYSDAYVLVTGNINVTGGDANTKVAFKNCSPFKKCRTE